MNREFSYYFDGVRYTKTELSFLQDLTKDCDDPQSVIDGIIESKEHFETEQNNN